MGQVKVSVIVPVYNVEKYLDQCLKSLVKQTLQEIEILVVNDGSPDGSQSIIDRYEARYPQKVFAFQKENGGLGDARNYGIERAQGEYIGFVDSDDWVEKRMFQSMYEEAIGTNSDVVICDFIEIKDGQRLGHVSYGYRGEHRETPINHYDFILNSLNPAAACNKLYKKSLFEIKEFPLQWYEDMATTPVLLSYAHKITYLPSAFYYYRQGQQSITRTTDDSRTLQVIDSWDACLSEVAPNFMEPMEVAVYSSICAFMSFKPEFSPQFLEYAEMNKGRFLKNEVIRKWIETGQVDNLFINRPDVLQKNNMEQKGNSMFEQWPAQNYLGKPLIPRTIHYCWFGGKPKSDLIMHCIESWKRNAPDFEIIEWNESNCDIHANRYVEEAYAAKKWAFVADYFRMEKIEEFGGLYLDTDTQLMRDPSQLLQDPAFFAFETRDAVHAGIFGAVPHHPLMTICKNSYQTANFTNRDGSYNTSYTIVRRISEQLVNLGIEFNGKEQILTDGTHIYPANKLTLDMFDGEIIAQHHYDCSWWDVQEKVSYKNVVLKDWFLGELGSTEISDLILQRDYYKKECERLENSTCWKITKPLRIVMDFLKKAYRKLKQYKVKIG